MTYLNELLHILLLCSLLGGTLELLPRVPSEAATLAGIFQDVDCADSPLRLAHEVEHARTSRVDITNGH